MFSHKFSLFFTLLLMLYLCVLYIFIFFFLYLMVNKVAYCDGKTCLGAGRTLCNCTVPVLLVCLPVYLLATFRENFLTDLHEIFRCKMGFRSPWEVAMRGEGVARCKVVTLCGELCKNS